MSFWKRLFRSREDTSLSAFSIEIEARFGVVTHGDAFVYIGNYFDGSAIPTSTPRECADQVNQLTADEICIMLTDPVLIILESPERGPLAIRTSLPALGAQEFLAVLKPAGVRVSENGKICLAKLIREGVSEPTGYDATKPQAKTPSKTTAREGSRPTTQESVNAPPAPTASAHIAARGMDSKRKYCPNCRRTVPQPQASDADCSLWKRNVCPKCVSSLEEYQLRHAGSPRKYCPRCRRVLESPGYGSFADLSLWLRGVCPKCQNNLVDV